MLAAGQRSPLTTAGLTNITWVQARAEDLPAAAPGPFRVVTFGSVVPSHGRAARRRDRLRHARTRRRDGRWSRTAPTDRPVPPSPGHPPIPHDELRALVANYLGSTTRMGQGNAPFRDHTWQDILVQTRFETYRRAVGAGHPGSAARHRQRHLGLPVDVLVGAASVRRSARPSSSPMPERCSNRNQLTACSGTGRATRRSLSRAEVALRDAGRGFDRPCLRVSRQ